MKSVINKLCPNELVKIWLFLIKLKCINLQNLLESNLETPEA